MVRVIICIKQTPDTAAEKSFTEDLLLDREGVPNVLNPFDEYAVEMGLRLKERYGVSLTALCMGAPSAVEAVRRAIAMGCDEGVLVSDPKLKGSDMMGTGRTLAAALQKLSFDLVLCGTESADARNGLVPAVIAGVLRVPLLNYAADLWLEEVNGQKVALIRREGPDADEIVKARLPCIAVITKAIGEPRLPPLRGIMKAKQKRVPTLTLTDLGLTPDEVGMNGARTKVLSAQRREQRRRRRVITDDGNAYKIIADFLEELKAF